ncbi:MAG: hypothetical protein ABI760_24585 [Ferruginibacter sp.]
MKKRIHYNKPQLRSMIIGAPTEVLIAGRGTGKTIGVLAPKSAQSYFKTMPRGTGVILNATFTQAFTRTLKELIRGWQMIGYVMDHHFLVGTRPSEKWKKKWNWQGPFAPPLDYKYFISWYNGAVAQIVSQERVGSSNGISIDWIIGDEAKLLNEVKLKTELLPANRGIIPAFAGNPYHHGMTLTSDMPIGTAGRWLLDKINDMDQAAVNDIWKLQVAKFQLANLYYPKTNAADRKEIDKQIIIIDEEINSIRKGLLYYHEASTLDNIHALGVDYIKQQIRDTSTFQFDTQILNLRPLRLEDGFYPDFDENFHGYFAEDEQYFDNRIIDPFNANLDCRKDKDLNTNGPIHIALDYNRRIHPLVVVQDNGREIRAVNGLHSLYPEKLKEALKQFNTYYKTHKRKLIYYWYDHTAVGGENETEKCQDVIEALEKENWIVIPMYIGKAPGHETKYRMYGHFLTEDGKYDKVLRINRENCKSLILSVGMSAAEQRKDGFGKDKKSEHDPNFPAEESTHYSDALDMIIWGMLESNLDYGVESKNEDLIIQIKK